MVRASPRTLSTRVRAKLPPSQLLLRTDRLYPWLTTIALLGAWRWGWGADRISHLTTGE